MKFTVIHNSNVYEFETANEMYIFGMGINLNVEEKLHIDIETFVEFVNECHKADCYNAPLKPFTEFLADWWKELHNRDKQFIVNNFYEIKEIA